MNDDTITMDLALFRDAIAILNCCEDAATEEHIRRALAVAVGMLLADAPLESK